MDASNIPKALEAAARAKEAKPGAIALDADSVWASFTIAGVEFEVEIYDAQDMLIPIDQAHRDDPATCLKCGHAWQLDEEQFGLPASELSCPAELCGHSPVKLASEFLDDVADLLKKRFKIPRCSRGEAGRFYTAILDAVADNQKKITQSPESDSG